MNPRNFGLFSKYQKILGFKMVFHHWTVFAKSEFQVSMRSFHFLEGERGIRRMSIEMNVKFYGFSRNNMVFILTSHKLNGIRLSWYFETDGKCRLFRVLKSNFVIMQETSVAFVQIHSTLFIIFVKNSIYCSSYYYNEIVSLHNYWLVIRNELQNNTKRFYGGKDTHSYSTYVTVSAIRKIKLIGCCIFSE